MKEFEGKQMFFRATGNNARYSKDKGIIVDIIKVARVFVTFKEKGNTHERKYRYKGVVLDNGHNGGYVAYATELELDQYYEKVKLSRLISNKYRYSRDYMDVDITALRQVIELLGLQLNINGD